MPKLTDAAVRTRASEVVLTWTVQGDLEDRKLAPWRLATALVGGTDGPIHALAFRHKDGRIMDQCVFDFGETSNAYVTQVTPQRVGDTWSAVFPRFDEMANSGTFRASLEFEDDSERTEVEGTF